MFKDSRKHLQKIFELLKEIDSYTYYKTLVNSKLDDIFKLYQSGKIDSVRYDYLKNKILRGRTHQELMHYYNNYIILLLKQIKNYNTLIFDDVYRSDVDDAVSKLPVKLRPVKKLKPIVRPIPKVVSEWKPKDKPVVAIEDKSRSKLKGELEPVIKHKTEPKPAPKIDVVDIVPEELIPESLVKISTKKPVEVPAEELGVKSVDKAAGVVAETEVKKVKPVLKPVVPVVSKKVKTKSIFERIKEFILTALHDMKEKHAKKVEEKEKAKKAALDAKKEERMLKIQDRIKQEAVDKKIEDVKGVEKLSDKKPSVTKVPFIAENPDVPDLPAGVEAKKKSIFRALIDLLTIKKKTDEEAEEKSLKELKSKGIVASMPLYQKIWNFIVSSKGKEKALEKAVTDEKPKEMDMTFGAEIKRETLKNVFQEWLDRVLKRKPEFSTEGTFISPSLVKLADVSMSDITGLKGAEAIDPHKLLEEAKNIKKRIAAKKSTPIYKPLLLGSVANVTVRPVTNWLILTFPDYFKPLYMQLRLANVQVLSNTYANIMVFVTTNAFIFSFFIYTILAILRLQPLIMAIVTGFAVAAACAAACFFAFYYYPNTMIAKRRKSIKTNMPFAINHIAAIASSGIPPVTMFKLLGESEEYGEFCIELRKIIDYIELFGYDLVTAVKAVAEITPDDDLKEFFGGMVSTIESGGDLEKYLMQKSKDSMASYQLERRQYAETVATYSDIYTGVLIAAPLFFVAALTLVSMLGGTIGGYQISTIIGIATYAVIPFMNIAFITFLNISQPEI